MIDLGTVRPGSTIRIPFSSFDKDDGSSITMTNYATSDILIYKDGSTTERASTAGFTATTDFDGKTGKHVAIIDLADNTTSGFFNAGSEYLVAIDAVTVDSVTTGGWIARFRIGYPHAVLDTTIATLSSQTSFTLTVGPAEDDALNGMWAIIHDIASAVQFAKVLVLDYTGSTKTVTLAAGATFTAAAGDNFSLIDLAPLQPATTGRTLVVDSNGLADANTVKVGPTGSGTAQTARDIGASVLLSSGTGTGQLDFTSGVVKANTTQFAGSAITSASGIPEVKVASIAANAITATSIASDAITDAKVASDVTIASVTGSVGSVTGAVGSVTGNVGGNVTGSVGSVTTVSSGAISEASFATTAGSFAPLGILDQGTAQSATSTTLVLRSAAAFANDELIGAQILITGGSAGVGQTRTITDYVSSTDTATVDTWTTTPSGTITYKIFASSPASVTPPSVTVAGISAAALADLFDTDSGTTYASAVSGSVVKEIADNAGGGTPPTAAAIADAVWDEILSGHAISGSTGEALGAAGGAGDPWITALPGSYSSGQAGYILGTNLNATVSSRASQTSVDTVDDFLDTEIAAIKAKTDNLPTDPADASDIATLIDALPTAAENATAIWAAGTRTLTGIDEDSTTLDLDATIRAAVGMASANLDTQLTAIDDYLDTEVTAIKAKTDQLTFTVANQIDANVLDWKSATAPAMTGDAYARLGAPAGASVSADIAAAKSDTSAIKAKTDSLTFTVSGNVDANIQYVNDTAVTGDGSPGTEWGP